MAEIAFESFDVPAVFLAKSAVMTSFASGRPTALVLDSGGSVTRVVPVYEGYILGKSITKQALAGQHLSEVIAADLEHRGITITPRFMVKTKEVVDAGQPAKMISHNRVGTTPSFYRAMKMRVIDEFKESVCQTFESTYDEAQVSVRPNKSFEFPDGYNLSFGKERYDYPEIMFQPNKFWPDHISGVPEGALGVHELIRQSINACDIDLRPHLLHNIVLSGGNTLFSNFSDRVHYEIAVALPNAKIRIHAAGNSAERKYGAWLGGSILASLGTFHQLWVSRKEWEEQGFSVVEKKCQ